MIWKPYGMHSAILSERAAKCGVRLLRQGLGMIGMAGLARTEAAARGQCKQPYIIGQGATGGVIMHLADEPKPQELRLKGSPSGKNYIGPPGPPPGERDREILSIDGRVL